MRISAICFAALLGVGCVSSSSTEEGKVVGTPGPSSCSGESDACKIEGSDIGREGVTIQLDGGTVSFVDWIPKAGSPGEYVGFSLEFSGMAKANYRVKAGTDRFYSSDTSWKHVGADCHGISNVDFGEGATEDPSDPGDGDGCQNPDGCPDDDDGTGPIL